MQEGIKTAWPDARTGREMQEGPRGMVGVGQIGWPEHDWAGADDRRSAKPENAAASGLLVNVVSGLRSPCATAANGLAFAVVQALEQGDHDGEPGGELHDASDLIFRNTKRW